jgi:sodium-dependent dicarboxylate transporter 2/3/5
MADPVLALFFGGFVLGEAASVHGIDRLLARRAFLLAGGQVRWLVAVVLGVTAFLSMWMSNIAAAALMIAAMKPMFGSSPEGVRRALLVAVALGANLGGMATPIGTGPNAIALAQIPGEPPSFLAWMAFALPLTVGSLVVAYGMLRVAHPLGDQTLHVPMAGTAEGERPLQVGGVALLAIAAWLLEPWHGVSAATVALALAAALFGTGLVPAARLRNVDWSTLLLIAGGLGLGELIERTGVLPSLASWLDAREAPPWLLRMALLSLAALMSALMSNTATAAMLIPLALALEPSSRALPILVAMAASFGMPFVISTPPNAMAVGAGASSRDLLWPGLVLMGGGCLVLALTGPAVLGWFLG